MLKVNFHAVLILNLCKTGYIRLSYCMNCLSTIHTRVGDKGNDNDSEIMFMSSHDHKEITFLWSINYQSYLKMSLKLIKY